MQTQNKFFKGIVFAFLLLAKTSLFAQSCTECDEEINFGGDLVRCENFENSAIGTSVASARVAAQRRRNLRNAPQASL